MDQNIQNQANLLIISIEQLIFTKKEKNQLLLQEVQQVLNKIPQTQLENPDLKDLYITARYLVKYYTQNESQTNEILNYTQDLKSKLSGIYFFLGENEQEPLKQKFYKLCLQQNPILPLSILSNLKLAFIYRESYDIRKNYFQQARQQLNNLNQRLDYKQMLKNFFNELEYIEILSNINDDMNEALKAYNNMILINPDKQYDYQSLYTLAHVYYDHLELNTAKKYFKKSLICNNQIYQTYFKLGYIYSEKNQEEYAVEHYKKALELKPDYLNALLNKGVSLQNLGKPLQAFQAFQQCLEIDPNYSKAFLNMGGLYSDQNQHEQALNCFQECLVYDNQDIKALNNIGICLSNLNREDEAIIKYQECINIDKSYYKAFINLGISYENQGNIEKAIETYKLNIKYNPNFYRTYILLGNLYDNLKQTENAIEVFKIGICLEGGNIEEIDNKKYHQLIPNLIKIQKDQLVSNKRFYQQCFNIKKSSLYTQFLRKEVNFEILEYLTYKSENNLELSKQNILNIFQNQLNNKNKQEQQNIANNQQINQQQL